MQPTATFEPPFRTPPQVQEGGVIEAEVGSGTKELSVFIPGHGLRRYRARNGRIEIPLPPGVRGGTRIFISDENYPNPHATTVTVVGSQ